MTEKSGGSRLIWLDANRFYAACGVIMIHSSTDTNGGPYTGYPVVEQIGPALLRSIATISSSEIFLLFSLFLLAMKIERRDPGYVEILKIQVQRLIAPLIVWSLFYAFFKLLKASEFGYAPAIWAQLSDPMSWVGYLFLGDAQYQLHFLPTMFGLVLIYPAMRAATKYPLLMLGAVPLLYAMDWCQAWLWGNVSDPLLRDYFVRFFKILGYTSYGLVAFGLYGIWNRGLEKRDCQTLFYYLLALGSIIYATKVLYTLSSVYAGRWVDTQGGALLGFLAMPIIVFTMFLLMQYRDWSPRYSFLAKFTYGVYLIHPVFIDLFDIFTRGYSADWSPLYIVIAKYLFVLPMAFTTVYLISKSRYTAWTVGIGPIPLLHRILSGIKSARG